MSPELESLTLLILLRCGNVGFPPLLRRWTCETTTELLDLHLIYAEALNSDTSSLETLLVLRHVYDWPSLLRAHRVLKDMWRHYLRTTIPLPNLVLSTGDILNRRVRSDFVPCFGHADGGNWDYQCALILETLHSASTSDDSNVLSPQTSEMDSGVILDTSTDFIVRFFFQLSLSEFTYRYVNLALGFVLLVLCSISRK